MMTHPEVQPQQQPSSSLLASVLPRTTLRFKHRLDAYPLCCPVEVAVPPLVGKKKTVILFPGGGKYAFWMAGVAAFLRGKGRLNDSALVGASAGALTVTLAVCGVDAKHAANVALRLLKEAGVWERPLGLIGVWGGIVCAWLDELLPPDAASLCSGRVHIAILQLLPFERLHVSEFKDKADLIEACMASCHLPLIMDGRPFSYFRGRPCVDGSILASRVEVPSGLKDHDTVLTFDYQHDLELQAPSIGFLSLVEPEGLYRLIDLGFSYAKRRLDEDGESQSAQQ